MRYKDRIFYRWKTWTPIFKKLNSQERAAIAWIRVKRLRKCCDVMILMCLDVIDKRSKSLKDMRKVKYYLYYNITPKRYFVIGNL